MAYKLTAGLLLLFLVALVNARTLTFQNQCPYTVWIGSTGGANGNCNSGCAQGQACLPAANICFWVLPTPDTGSFMLAPGGSSNVYLNNPPANGVQWSGNVWARVGCNSQGEGCNSGDCGDCPPGTGPTGPTTLAEFTLLSQGTDYYDISIINGVNVGIEMAPANSGSSEPYICGNAGGSNPNNGALQGCSWNFNPTVNNQDLSPYLNYVTSGGQGCSSNSQCGGGQVCGLDIQKNQVCGDQLGYFTADEVCGGDNFGSPFFCGNSVPGQGTRNDLYGCTPPNSLSCYSGGVSNTCCGCPQWNVNGQNLATQFDCQNNNSYWYSYSQPFLQFLKNGCPTAYTFPYDDATSGFTCGSGNSENYVITYCP